MNPEIDSENDIYARQLIRAAPRRGYPLWHPEPGNQLPPEYRNEGHGIGDVCAVREDGGIDVFFNICLPPTHPLHSHYGVPEDFKQIVLSPLDISRLESADYPGSVVAPRSITQTNLTIGTTGGSTSATSPIQGGLSIQFDSPPTEGAILVLPEGSRQETVKILQTFFEEAALKGKSWYNFARTRLGRMISSDSIYLITGCHKTSSWALVAFRDSKNSSSFNLKFTAGNIADRNATATYRWAKTTSIPSRIGPYPHDGKKNQAVFIRGFRIALRQIESFSFPHSDVIVSYELPKPVSSSLKYREMSGLGMRHEDFSQAFEGGDTIITRCPGDPVDFPQSSGCCPSIQNDLEFDDPSLYNVSLPIAKIYHPSNLINQLLLDKDPSCDIAVTHDDLWAAIIDDLPSDRNDPNDISEAIKRECSKYAVLSYHGAAYFSPSHISDTGSGLQDDGNDSEHSGSPYSPPEQPSQNPSSTSATTVQV